MSHDNTANKPIDLRRLASAYIAKPLVYTRVMSGQLIAARLANGLVAALLLAIDPPGFRPAAVVLLFALFYRNAVPANWPANVGINV